MLRRWAARRACWRFLMMLSSGSPLIGFALAGFASTAAVGASSAAMFTEAAKASGESGALVCSDAIGAASFAGDEACSLAAIWVSSAAALGLGGNCSAFV